MINIEFKWVISMECQKSIDGLTDVVSVIHWRRYGMAYEYVDEMNNPYYADVFGRYECPSPDGDFVPYSDLTEDIVLSWFASTLPVNEFDVKIRQVIEERINPNLIQYQNPWDKK